MWAITPKIDWASNKLNAYLHSYTDWTCLQRITIKAKKTKAMIIRRRNKCRRLLTEHPIIDTP
jgi:hypothetical protein